VKQVLVACGPVHQVQPPLVWVWLLVHSVGGLPCRFLFAMMRKLCASQLPLAVLEVLAAFVSLWRWPFDLDPTQKAVAGISKTLRYAASPTDDCLLSWQAFFMQCISQQIHGGAYVDT
jgi:hypothetical protein